MAQATAPPTSPELAQHLTPAATTAVQHPPVTPGKVAMWLFLATEVMFFTGLIGSYIVLRAGSPHWAYSNLYAPGTDLTRLGATEGVFVTSAGHDAEKLVPIFRQAGDLTEAQAEERAHELAHGHTLINGLTEARAHALEKQLVAAGASAEVVPLKSHKWPLPYDELTNPL